MTRRRALHLLARAALCLALGLVTTVAVAWAMAWRGGMGPLTECSDLVVAGGRWWAADELRRPGVYRLRSSLASHGGSDIPSSFMVAPAPDLLAGRAAARIAWAGREGRLWSREASAPPQWLDERAGWPLLALGCSSRVVRVGSAWATEECCGGLVVRAGGTHDVFGTALYAVPLRPLGTGLAVNTLLYAGLWLPLLSAGPLRRWRRVRRGLCRRCAYNLAGVASACPECGTPREATP